MSNIATVDASNIINSLMQNRINPQIAWGTNNMPANALPGWFGGATSGVPQVGTTGEATITGAVGGPKVEGGVNFITGLFAQINRKRIIIYFQGNGLRPAQTNVINTAPWTEVQYDGTAIGYWNPSLSVGGLGGRLGEGMPAGRPVTQAALVNYCNAKYNQWWGAAGGVVTGTLTNTVCHYSCHSNCHGSRGRR